MGLGPWASCSSPPPPGPPESPPHPTGHVCPPAPTWSRPPGRADRRGCSRAPPAPGCTVGAAGCAPGSRRHCGGAPRPPRAAGSRPGSRGSDTPSPSPGACRGLFTGGGSGLPTGAGLGPGLGCCVLSVGSTFAPLNSGSASAPVPAHSPPGGPTASLCPQPRRGAGSSPAGAHLLLGVRSGAPGRVTAPTVGRLRPTRSAPGSEVSKPPSSSGPCAPPIRRPRVAALQSGGLDLSHRAPRSGSPRVLCLEQVGSAQGWRDKPLSTSADYTPAVSVWHSAAAGHVQGPEVPPRRPTWAVCVSGQACGALRGGGPKEPDLCPGWGWADG